MYKSVVARRSLLPSSICPSGAYVTTVSENDPFEDLGVPDDPLADLDRATQRLSVHTDVRRYGKKMVIVEGFDGDVDVAALASDLKSAIGTGGTVKGGRIELQGDHEKRVQVLLKARGYRIES